MSEKGLIIATPQICELLGKTPEQIKAATLRDLADWAYERGFVWQISSKDREPGRVVVKVEGENVD